MASLLIILFATLTLNSLAKFDGLLSFGQTNRDLWNIIGLKEILFTSGYSS